VRIILHWRDYGTKLEELLPYTLPLAALHILFMFLGWQLGRKRKWAAAISTILSAILSLFLLSVLTGFASPPYPSVYAEQRIRDVVFSLLFCIFSAQAVLCACAWRALSARGLSAAMKQQASPNSQPSS
jgi:formate hydrogenlyase subunit 3/multisubunit Na+/H+ antiporter MnhD subunit